jgi:hypothetical protein
MVMMMARDVDMSTRFFCIVVWTRVSWYMGCLRALLVLAISLLTYGLVVKGQTLDSRLLETLNSKLKSLNSKL